jgi:surface antigen
MKVFAATMLALAATAAGPAAQANELWTLKNSPASKFNQADFKMLRSAIDQSLAGAPEGTPVDWKNDKTGAAGTVTPSGVDGSATNCRRLRIANTYKLMKDDGVYVFCKGSTGKWKLR